MNIRPYIGITDFTSFEQVQHMLEIFFRFRKPKSHRLLHVGVMMSHKTLNGIESKWTNAFPPKESISGIFQNTGNTDTYYCLHYADYDHQTTANDLRRAVCYGGTWINAVQLDMPWPEPNLVVNGIHMSRKHLEVILQVGQGAMKEAGNNPAEIVKRIEDYKGLVHRVLLDASMGRGIGMDTNLLIPLAHEIRDRFPAMGIVVAGGLGPLTIDLVEPFTKEFPDASIDAQGKLRPSGSALDPIDWNMAALYLQKALDLLE